MIISILRYKIRPKVVTTSSTVNKTWYVPFQSSLILFHSNVTVMILIIFYDYKIRIPPYMHSTRLLINCYFPLTSFMFHILSTITHSETLDLSENMILKSIIHNTNVFTSLDDLKHKIKQQIDNFDIILSLLFALYVYCGANK